MKKLRRFIMSKPDYAIRNYQPSDFKEFTRLYTSANRIPAENIRDVLERPGFTAAKDLFLAESDGHLVAYAHLTPEPAIGRVILRGWIEPAYRRKGLARKLLERVAQRCQELDINRIHVFVPQTSQTSRAILPKLGFSFVRRYLDMEINPHDIPREELEEAAGKCRQLRPGEEEILVELQNRAFRYHWGYSPGDLATITHDINDNNRSPRDVIVACNGEIVIGYCWTETVELESTSGKAIYGVINMIGIEPELRGKGLGRRVLLAGIARQWRKGAGNIGLTVDAQNSIARELYRMLGFRECGSTLWYEKIIDRST